MKNKAIKNKRGNKRVKAKDEHLSKSRKKKKLIVKRVKNPPPFVRQGNNLFRDDGKILLGEIVRQDEEFLYVRKELGSTILYRKKLCVSEC